jgi:hypothetical protein
MKRTVIAIAIALSGETAYAGGSDAYPDPVSRPIYAQQVLRDTGSENYPTFGPGQTQVIAGNSGLLPANGSDGVIQSANSVPASTIYGTTAFANAAHGKVSRQVAVGAVKRRG